MFIAWLMYYVHVCEFSVEMAVKYMVILGAFLWADSNWTIYVILDSWIKESGERVNPCPESRFISSFDANEPSDLG